MSWSLLAALWLGCRGEPEGSTEPVTVELPLKRVGNVSLTNRTAYAIEVAYFNAVDASAGISDAVLPAGQASNSTWH